MRSRCKSCGKTKRKFRFFSCFREVRHGRDPGWRSRFPIEPSVYAYNRNSMSSYDGYGQNALSVMVSRASTCSLSNFMAGTTSSR